MKNALVAILLLAVVSPFALAVKTGTDATNLLVQLPPCALTCLSTSVAKSTCSPTDTACVCSNVPLNAVIRACVQSSCTIKQSLKTLNVTHHLCEDPIRDARRFYNTLSDVLGILSFLAVLLRFYSRWISTQHFWYDDYTIAFVIAIGIPSSVMNVAGLTYNGLGLDIWQVGYKQITDFIHVFFVMEILYFIHVGVVKISILFFYLRLFPDPKFRKWVWGTLILDGVSTFLFVIVGIFQCAPISFYWTNWDNEHHGKCMNINALGWSNAAVSIAFDFWMLALPMSQLRHLQLHWKRKLGVASMFGVGFFVTIVSIIRLRTLVRFSATQNPTWDYAAVGSWSTIEINTAIVCACMPNLRFLLVHYFPGLMETPRAPSFAMSQNRNEQKRRLPDDLLSEDSSRWSKGSSFMHVSFSSKVPDDWDEMKHSSLKPARLEIRRVRDDVEPVPEPDHERHHHPGNWV